MTETIIREIADPGRITEEKTAETIVAAISAGMIIVPLEETIAAADRTTDRIIDRAAISAKARIIRRDLCRKIRLRRLHLTEMRRRDARIRSAIAEAGRI
jgi:hypothetical protein